MKLGKPRLELVATAAAFEMGMTLEGVRGPRRFKHIVRARRLYAYVARHCGFSLAEIGHAINKDHSTIFGALAVARRLVADRGSFWESVKRVSLALEVPIDEEDLKVEEAKAE